MTMPMPHGLPTATQELHLPAPQFPMLTRMISNPLFPDQGNEPITWIVSGTHPLVPDMVVRRMLVDRDGRGVEVYSVSGDGRQGMRNLVPMPSIRLIEEAMPLDIFIEELTIAESGEDEGPFDDNDGDGGDGDDGGEQTAAPAPRAQTSQGSAPQPAPVATAAASNGQPDNAS